jgi:hypothetical protein
MNLRPTTCPSCLFWCALIVLTLSPGSAFAYIGVGLGPFTTLGLFMGALVGLFIALLLTVSTPYSSLTKTAIAFPALTIGLVLGTIIGIKLGFEVDMLRVYNSSYSRSMRHSAQFKRVPLQLAACAADVEQVRKLASTKLEGASSDYLGGIFNRCIIRNNDTHAEKRLEIFKLLVPLLHRQYLNGQVTDPENYYRRDYCSIPSQLIFEKSYTRLRSLLALKLPLNCEGGKSRLTFRFQDEVRKKATPAEQEVQMIEFLHSHGAPLDLMRDEFDQSLLDQVVEYGNPQLIVALLRAGIDPGHYPKGSSHRESPAAMVWAKRKFMRCSSCPAYYGEAPLTQTEINGVDSLMRPPTANEINYLDDNVYTNTALHQLFQDSENQPDGGAAYFRYLKAHGADVGIATRGHYRVGFLAYARNGIHPALLAELEKLTPQEVDRMAHPTMPGSGEKGVPLLETARENRNQALIDFLCARKVDGCAKQ